MPLNAYRTLALLLLIAFGVGGFLQSVSQYPFQVPDERTHWLAGVSRVNAWMPGRNAACDSLMGLAEHFQLNRIAFHAAEKAAPGLYAKSASAASVCVDPQMNYGFVLSYPGVVAALLCRAILPLSDVTVFFLARVFEGLMVLGVLWLLFRVVAAEGKPLFWRRFTFLLLTSLMLTPIGMQQSFGVSVDPLINAMALFVVYLLWKDKLSTADFVLYLVLGGAAAITKPPLLAWLVPLGVWLHWNGKFPRGKEFLFWAETTAIVAVTVGMSYVSVVAAVPLDRANPAAQMAFIKAHPLEAFGVLWRGVRFYLHRPGLLSHGLGWLDFGPTAATVRLQRLVEVATVLAFLLPLAAAWRSVRVSWHRPGWRAVVADLFLGVGVYASMIGIAFFLYLYWTVPGAPNLDGLQMRYFLCHIVVFFGWWGVRMDAVAPMSFNPPALHAGVYSIANTLVALGLLAFVLERCFSNLVRYF